MYYFNSYQRSYFRSHFCLPASPAQHLNLHLHRTHTNKQTNWIDFLFKEEPRKPPAVSVLRVPRGFWRTCPPPLLSAAGGELLRWLREGSGGRRTAPPETAGGGAGQVSVSHPPRVCLAVDLERYLVRAELLSEAGVRTGDVHRQTVLHPLQEGHPALALLLEALPPQRLRLQLAAREQRQSESLRLTSQFGQTALNHVVKFSKNGP